MKNRPDSDLYPPYSDDYFNDMKTWKEQTGCKHPTCDCTLKLVKGSCQFESEAIIDLTKTYPEIIF